MKPDDIATAITQALVQGGAQWLVSTIVAFLPVLWTMTLILHLGRPYVLRTLRRCGLRLGADIWWMSYLILRDALLVATFALSWVFFLPKIVSSAALPITGSLSALCLLIALAIKLSRRVDDDKNAYRLSTAALVLGATLYYGPQVFAVEAASQPYLAGFAQAFTSNTNPGIALILMWIALLGVIVVVGWMFVRTWMAASRSMGGRMSTPAAPPTSKEPVAGAGQ
ncbi:MAG TPA: hypothetical protein VKV37_12105 [Ktedonobacteraceae bacterium]|jgi:hypothetical protein|nr:hypothetical protein [Ktedonobacteraceae bacterium]